MTDVKKLAQEAYDLLGLQQREGGFVCLSTKDVKNGKWDDHKLPFDLAQIEMTLKFHGEESFELYFGTQRYDKGDHRAADYVTKSRVLHAEIDGATGPEDWEKAGIMPSYYWTSSTDASGKAHYHCLWVLAEEIDGKTFDLLEKLLCAMVKADNGSVSRNKVLRIPGSINHKYDPPQHVGERISTGETYAPTTLGGLLAGLAPESSATGAVGVQGAPSASDPMFNAPIKQMTVEALERLADRLGMSMSLRRLVFTTDESKGRRSQDLRKMEYLLAEEGIMYEDALLFLFNSKRNKGKFDDRPEQLRFETAVAYAEKGRPGPLTPDDEKEDADPNMAAFDEDVMGDLSSCEFLDIAELRRRGPQPLDMAIQDVVPAKGVTLIYADVNVGKTLMAGDMAGCEATGTMWAPVGCIDGERVGGFAVKKGVVVILNLDDPAEIQEQNTLAISNTYGIEDDSRLKIFDKPKGFSLMSLDDVKALYRRLRGLGVTRIIFDNFGQMSGADENGSEQKIAINNAKKLAKALDCGITLIHHANKSGGDVASLNSANGSKTLARYVDQAIQLIERKNTGIIELWRLKVRGAEKSKKPLLLRCFFDVDADGLTVGYRYMQVVDDGKKQPQDLGKAQAACYTGDYEPLLPICAQAVAEKQGMSQNELAEDFTRRAGALAQEKKVMLAIIDEACKRNLIHYEQKEKKTPGKNTSPKKYYIGPGKAGAIMSQEERVCAEVNDP